MRILFLSGHLPCSSARQAGQKTSYYMCEFLSRKHNVHLVAFANPDEKATCELEAMHIFASWEMVPITTGKRLVALLLSPWLPVAVAARGQRTFREKVRSLLTKQQFDVAILDHTAMWQYANSVRSVPLIGASAHDVLSQLWQRKTRYAKPPLKWLHAWERRRLCRWETEILDKMDFVTAHNQKDAQILAEINPKPAQCPVQPWSSVGSSLSAENQVHRESNSIVFWGAMDRRENLDAVEFALGDILPRVAQEFPEYKFYVAGAHSDKLQHLKKSDSRVHFTGFVPDITSFLSSKQIALLPLRLGAGIKVKTLECMAAGLGVVTTPVGAEGIQGRHGEDYLIGGSAEELAAHVLELLRSPGLSVRLGGHAQTVVHEEHGFEKAMERLELFLLEHSAGSKSARADVIRK